MKTYRVSWLEYTHVSTEVEVPDDADDEEIIEEARRQCAAGNTEEFPADEDGIEDATIEEIGW